MNKLPSKVVLFFTLTMLLGCKSPDSAESLAKARSFSKLRMICDALTASFEKKKIFPANESEMKRVIFDEQSGYLRSGASIDEWDRTFDYRLESTLSATVWSYGADKDSSNDDLICTLTVLTDGLAITQIINDGLMGNTRKITLNQ